MEPIRIDSRRELMWDGFLIDQERTDAPLTLHHPVQRDCVVFTEPWAQGVNNAYMCVLKDGERYLMYTNCRGGLVCSQSTDGIHWERPDLGLVEYEGSRHNALVSFTDSESGSIPHAVCFDGFRAFVDDNPSCTPEERIKAVANVNEHLQLYVSLDGLRFRHAGTLIIPAQSGTPFDSVNTVFYDKRIGKYRAYVRDYEPPAVHGDPIWIRAISTTESEDLFPSSGEWPRAQFLKYDTPDLWQMYTNSVMPYERANHIYVGFPVRYTLRPEWTDNYDELCGREARLMRAGEDRKDRHGLSLSDTLFMCSRDGRNFSRFPEAFLRPGPEHPKNWVYGSVYFSNGMFETAPNHPGCDPEFSFYCMENRFFSDFPEVRRYTIRLDGFVSRSSVYPESWLNTKPFIFEGRDLFVNFSTSAYGHLLFTLTDMDGKSISSCETFGDSTDRRVRFKGSVGDFSGRPVILKVNFSDADLYSIMFR